MGKTFIDPRMLCECGHTFEVHTHHRRGTDCSLCDICPNFRSTGQILPANVSTISPLMKGAANRQRRT